MMRSLGILTATIVLIAAGPASQPSTRAVEFATFISNQYNFQLDYPKTWTVLDHPVNQQVFSMQTQPVDAVDRNLGVMGLRVTDGPKTGDDSAILKDVSDAIVNYVFNHGGVNTVIKPDKLGELAARRIRFDTQQSTGTTTAVYVIAVHHHTEYVFAIAAPATQIDKMMDDVDAVLKSFKLNP